MYPLICFFTALLLFSCNGNGQPADTVAANPEDLRIKESQLIENYLQKAVEDSGKTGDSLVLLHSPGLIRSFYEPEKYAAYWSKGEQWLPEADSLFGLIRDGRLLGLYPEDYHFTQLAAIRGRILADSTGKSARKDAHWWSAADLLLTDALIRVVNDVKLGRLPQDSISMRKDSVLADSFILSRIKAVREKGLGKIIRELEPTARGYLSLKAAIPGFLAKADFSKTYTRIPYPEKDPVRFNRALQKRLFEEGLMAGDSLIADSLRLAEAVKRYQKKMNITIDGKAGEGTVRMLNTDDREKFARIAISLDKYKQLPERMPARYIWVNTSANYMEVIDSNKVKISSKVITGKSKTRTPLLTSLVSNIITYPQWVPPPSIIQKEILPAVKKNPGYLAKKGFSLLDKEGNEVDPYSVDWSKYSKGIPYRVVQGSGDANALGIIKFVFDNKYSVYLHDTNQRYLFSNAMRSLSHGCVRVQEWDKLAWYILRSDSVLAQGKGTVRIDSVKSWLKNKQKKTVPLKNKVPVFIRYFTCEGQNGNLVFFDDVYGEDKYLRQRFFGDK
jgi:murein L,D-transpeptidase YcbB/YkuD